jgi:hypothetical protein
MAEYTWQDEYRRGGVAGSERRPYGEKGYFAPWGDELRWDERERWDEGERRHEGIGYWPEMPVEALGGPYVGRGPKSYRRPDERICDDVCSMLTRHPDIDATNVDVNVEGGIVSLKGHVDTRMQKRLAEDLAWQASGVRDVQNSLKASTVEAQRGGESITVTDQGSLKGRD